MPNAVEQRVTPFGGPRSVRATVGRALRLRCPRCGASPLYAGVFRMHEQCAVCGFRYEREPGYFVGAIYVNYAATTVLTVGTVLVLDWTVGLRLATQLAIGVTLSIVLPLLFFRHARSIWLGLGYLVTQADERAERRRLRGR